VPYVQKRNKETAVGYWDVPLARAKNEQMLMRKDRETKRKVQPDVRVQPDVQAGCV